MIYLLIFVPILGTIYISLLSSDHKGYDFIIRRVGLITSLIALIISLFLYLPFCCLDNDYKFVVTLDSISRIGIFRLGIDGLSFIFILLTTFLLPICILSIWNTVTHNVKSQIICLLLVESLLCIAFSSLDLFVFYISFEAVLIPLFIIVGLHGSTEGRIRASLLLFLYTIFGSFFMLLGIIKLFSVTGTSDMILLNTGILMSPLTQRWIWLGIFLGIATKTPLVPLHGWLFRAHAEASLAGSILLAGIILKLATYAYLRILIPILPEACDYFRPLALTLACFSLLHGSIATVRQVDTKVFIAYSSVGHLAVNICGLASGTIEGINGAIIMSFAHGLISPALFVIVGGILYERYVRPGSLHFSHVNLRLKMREFITGAHSAFQVGPRFWFFTFNKPSNKGEPFVANLERQQFIMTHLIVSLWYIISRWPVSSWTCVRMIGESRINLVVADEAVVNVKGTTYQKCKSNWVMFKEFGKRIIWRPPFPKRQSSFSNLLEKEKGYVVEKQLYLRTIGFAPKTKTLFRHVSNCEGLNKATSKVFIQRRFLHQETENVSFNILKQEHKGLSRRISESIQNNKWPLDNALLKKEVYQFVESFQKFIALEVSNESKISEKVLYYMKEILCSPIIRVYSITELKKNKGSKTPGVDGVAFTKSNKNLLIELFLSTDFKHLAKYECLPIKRVYIKQIKPNKTLKIRPLGIPCLYDRLVQKMFLTVLDPAIDVLSDTYSFGFRKHRSCHMAIGIVAKCLSINPDWRVVMDFDIKGLFDNIHHDWILENFPMPTNFEHVLKSWLKAKIFTQGENDSEELTSGVSQGGIISPLIANWTLNGLEKAAFQNVAGSMYLQNEKKEKIKRDISRNLIRYADDFLVITTSPKTETIFNNIKLFLEQRGLQMNLEKSKIVHMKDDKAKFSFLGYTFIRFDSMKKNRFSSLLEKRDNKLLVIPALNKFIAIRRYVKALIKKNQNAEAITLIQKLNPVLRGWSNYFSLGTSSQILGSLDAFVHKRLIHWMKHKYDKTSVQSLIKTFFVCKGNDLATEASCKSPFNLKWHFHWTIKNQTKSRKNVIWLVKAAYLTNRIPAHKFAYSKQILKVSPYVDNTLYLEKQSAIRIAQIKTTNNNYEQLLILQNFTCEWCNENLNEKELHPTHHILPLSVGGPNLLTNLTIVHHDCHMEIHKLFGYKQITLMNYPRTATDVNKERQGQTHKLTYNKKKGIQ